MKKSNFPFRKLSVYKFPIVPILFSLCLVVNACKSLKPNPSITVVGPKPIVVHRSQANHVWINITSQKATLSNLRFGAKSCADQRFVFGATLGVLGQSYDLAFEEEGDQLVLASVEDSETKLSGLEINKALKDALCVAQISGDDQLLTENTILVDEAQVVLLQNTILAAMKQLVPDCTSLEFGAKEAKCRLASMQPEEAMTATEQFQKVMIQKWSRQPYILARRSGVVTTLARIAAESSPEEAYLKFCRVLKFSIPEELPVVMTSLRWQQAVCSGQASLRQEAALYGLAKGIQELALLRELYEETSLAGTISIKIPLESIPGRALDVPRQPLRITIAPDVAVSQKLMDTAKKFLGRSEQDEAPKRLVRHRKNSAARRVQELAEAQTQNIVDTLVQTEICWHPLFSASRSLLQIADGMKLTGKGFHLECGFVYDHDAIAGTESAALSKYLIQSLSSETEFVIDNGQTKLLRLPEGQYKYTVHALPANPLDAEEQDEKAGPKSTGELGWGTNQRHTIKSW